MGGGRGQGPGITATGVRELGPQLSNQPSRAAGLLHCGPPRRVATERCNPPPRNLKGGDNSLPVRSWQANSTSWAAPLDQGCQFCSYPSTDPHQYLVFCRTTVTERDQHTSPWNCISKIGKLPYPGNGRCKIPPTAERVRLELDVAIIVPGAGDVSCGGGGHLSVLHFAPSRESADFKLTVSTFEVAFSERSWGATPGCLNLA